MPESPWERAAQQNEQAMATEDRVEELQSNAEGAGLAGAVGFMAVSAVAPMAAKKGLKMGVKAFGKRAASSKVYKETVQRAKKYADEANSFTGSVDKKYMDRAIKDVSGVKDRAKISAARQYNSGGDADLTQFLGDVGFKGPTRLRENAGAYRKFKQSKAAKNKGVLRALSESKNQRKLLGSAMSHIGAEQAAVFPATYAADSALGVTGEGSDTSWYDVPGQAQDMIEYLPTYAAFEGAAGLGIGAAGALKGTARAAKNYFSGEGSETAARAVSSAFDGMSQMANSVRNASAEASNRYNQRVRNASGTKMVQRGAEQARGFMMDRAKGAQSSVERFLSKNGERRSRSVHKTSDTVRGASAIFSDKGGRTKLTEFVKQAGEGTEGAMRDVKNTLFAEPGVGQKGGLGGFFGGETVRAGDIGSFQKTDSGEMTFQSNGTLKLNQAAEKELAEIATGLDKAKRSVNAEAGNIKNTGAASVLGSMKAENLKVSGYSKVGGNVMRMPTASDAKSMVGRAMESATKIRVPGTREGFSVSNIVGGRTLTGRRASVEFAEGAMPVTRTRGGKTQDDLVYFGKTGEGANVPQAAASGEGGQVFERGLTVKSGMSKARIYGQKADGKTTGLGNFFVSPRGKDQAYNVRMRQHTENEKYHLSKRASITAKSSDPMSRVGKMFDSVKQSLSLGSADGSMFQRARDYMSDAAPRRLFAEDSDLWNVGLATSNQEGQLPVADAIFATRQALTNSTDAYTNPEMFSSALESVGIKGETLKELGGVEGILKDDEKALQAAKKVMDDVAGNLQTDGNRVLQAPSTSVAKRYIREAGADPNSLYNKFGESRGQTLRRYIFEQGTIGASHGQKQTGQMMKKLDTLAKRGEINADMAQQAKVGLMSLDMQVAAGRRLKDPYSELDDMGPGFGADRGIQQAVGVMRENKDMLAKFAETRPRVDVAYHRDPYSSPDQFGSPFAEAGFFATDSATTAASTYIEGGMDTMRRALDEIGLGWSPTTSLSTSDGIREVGKTWVKRGAAAVTTSGGHVGVCHPFRFHSLAAYNRPSIPHQASQRPLWGGFRSVVKDL